MTDAALTKCQACQKDTRLGFGCPDCVNRVLRKLRELDLYWQFLPNMIQPVRGTTGRLSPGYASSPPLRLDVVAFLAPTDLAPVEDDDVRSLPSTVDSLAAAIAEERGDEPAGLPYLREHLAWCGRQLEWFGDLAEQITELHHRAQQLAKDRPQKPLGNCLTVTCDGQVRWGGPGRPARCGRCSRQYDGLDLVRLEAAQEIAA